MATATGSAIATENYKAALRILQSLRTPPRSLHESAATRAKDVLPSGDPIYRGNPPLLGMSDWLGKLGYSDDDVRRLRIIHVTGTKGKGSTCAFVDSFLRAIGNRTGFPSRTGLYTSPHLIDLTERIRINFKPLPEDLFAEYFFDIYRRLADEPRKPRYRQLLTLLSLHTFLQQNVDVAIYETHKGGEFDPTNVITHPSVTAITTIGLDHVNTLGPSIENIAWHKAGIFKFGALALSVPQEDSVAKVLQRRAVEKKVELKFTRDELCLPPQFPHVQAMNSTLARDVVNAFLEKLERPCLSNIDIAQGTENFRWMGRFDIIREANCVWFLDGAHNELSVPIAAKWFQVESGQQQHDSAATRLLFFSHVSGERDGLGLFRVLLQHIRLPIHQIIIPALYSRSDRMFDKEKEANENYSKECKDIPVSNFDTVGTAMQFARTQGTMVHIFVTGSLYLVGRVLQEIEGKT